MKAVGFVLSTMLLTICSGTQGQTASTPILRPIGPALDVRPPFAFDKAKSRRSVSGITCSPHGTFQQCLIVFDEGTKAQFAVLGTTRLEPIGALIEMAGVDAELDAEGAALADGFYYVTGSHSVKRTSCKPNQASRAVVRFRATAASGLPPRIDVSELMGTSRLWDLMLEDSYLRLHVDGCLGNGTGGSVEQMQRRPGINIEGVAVTGGRLYAGFRGPSEGGVTPVFSVDAKALFEGGDAKPRLHRLSLGERVGIRDMAVARDSILLLLGPDDHESMEGAAWQIAEWRPDTDASPRPLAVLDARKEDMGQACFEALKPEALAILEELEGRFRIVVLSDGVCDGGPLIFDVPK